MARTGRPRKTVPLSNEEEAELTRLVAASTTQQRVVLRSRIVLLAGKGMAVTRIAAELGVSTATVTKWRDRFVEKGIGGLLKDAPRSGRKPSTPEAVVRKVIDDARYAKPPGGSSHWTTRDMARHAGISQASVTRIWNSVALQPHRQSTFKLSTDPLFIDKVIDVVGLYLNPPDNAIVLCADEKTQIQARSDTRPRQPVEPDRPATRTDDYARHGTTVLFSAFNIITGEVIHKTEDRHRALEWLDFLQQIDHEVPADLDIHIVCDNYDTHKTAEVRDWLDARPRFHLHFTPTSASWLNQVERWFSLIQNKLLARADVESVDELNADIDTWVTSYNQNPKPFIWVKTAENIIGKVLRLRDRLISRNCESRH